jgi:hypothetical protein
MKRLIIAAVLVASTFGLVACQDDATIASHNLAKSASNFEILRRVVFINGITGDYLLAITGLCSIEDQVNQLEVTCKDGDTGFKKHLLGLSDNVTYLVQQMNAVDVSVYHTRITFKPQSLLPDVDFRGDAGDLGHRDTSD